MSQSLALNDLYQMFEKSKAVLLDTEIACSFDLAPLTGLSDNEFARLSWQADGYAMGATIAENCHPRLAGEGIELVDTEGELLRLFFLVPKHPLAVLTDAAAGRAAQIPCVFVSCWDHGTEVRTPARLNLESGELEIEVPDVEGLDILMFQKIEIGDHAFDPDEEAWEERGEVILGAQDLRRLRQSLEHCRPEKTK